MYLKTSCFNYTSALILLLILVCVEKTIAQEDIELIPANISATYFTSSVGKIKLNNFSEDSALIKLFPGKFYKIKQDETTYTIEAWNCITCKQTEFEGDWSIIGSPDTFPRKAGNDTRVIGSVGYKGENGNDHILLATSTKTAIAELT